MLRATRTDGPVIDIHCHRECGPAGELMAEAARAAGKVALGHGNPTTQAVNKRQLEFIRPKMDLLDVRLEDMDRMGVDIQAVAVAVYQYYYWADPDLGAKVSRIINEEFVESTSKYPGRFLPLGTVPLQDTDAAIQELRYLAQELGMRGIEIGTHVEGEEISSPRLDPFWAEVQKLGLVVVIHTQGATHAQRLADHNFVNIIGHAFEATLATSHLIFDGVVARYPDLKIVVVHGGGYLPAYAGRIDHGWRARADVSEGCRTCRPATCASSSSTPWCSSPLRWSTWPGCTAPSRSSWAPTTPTTWVTTTPGPAGRVHRAQTGRDRFIAGRQRRPTVRTLMTTLQAHGTVGLAVIGCGTVGRIRAKLAREYPGIGWLGLCDADEQTLKDLEADTDADFATTNVAELLARPEVGR